MGITGLLPRLQPVTKHIHISEFRGKIVAVDGYCWLHKAIYGCCIDICIGKSSDQWIYYCINLFHFDENMKIIFTTHSF